MQSRSDINLNQSVQKKMSGLSIMSMSKGSINGDNNTNLLEEEERKDKIVSKGGPLKFSSVIQPKTKSENLLPFIKEENLSVKNSDVNKISVVNEYGSEKTAQTIKNQ